MKDKTAAVYGYCGGFCGYEAMEKKLPRVLIAGTNSGCGKTTLVSGLLTLLNRRGVKLCSSSAGRTILIPCSTLLRCTPLAGTWTCSF